MALFCDKETNNLLGFLNMIKAQKQEPEQA